MAGSLKEKARNLWKEIKQGNWDYVLDALAYRLPVRVFSYFHFYLYSTDKLNLRVIENPETWCRFANAEDLDELVKLGINQKILKWRLERNHRVAIAGTGEDLLAVLWVSTGNKKYPGPDSYFLYGGYTSPDARGQGLSSLAQRLVHSTLSAEGRTRIFGSIGALNKASIRIHERMGYMKTGEAFYTIILGIVIVYFKSWPFDEGRIRFFLKKPPDNDEIWYLP